MSKNQIKIPKYQCKVHSKEDGWECFECNGTINHIQGRIEAPVPCASSVDAFMEAVYFSIDIEIVKVEDTDTITYGMIKQLAKKHLGYKPKK